MKNILVINPFGIGDVLFSTPLVSALKEAYSDSYIAYICNIKTKDILVTNPAIDEVFVFERDEYRNLWKESKIAAIKKFLAFWAEIKKRRFNIVFDLSLGKEYSFFCWRSGIKDRRGFNYKNRGRFLNHRIEFDGFNDKPIAEYYLGLLGNRRPGLNLAYGSDKTVLVTSQADKGYIDNFLKTAGMSEKDILIGIAPGGGMSFGAKGQDRKRWPAEKFGMLADKLMEGFNAKIILIWGPGEEDLLEKIKSVMKNKALIAPKTTIREAAALMRRCKFIVSNDGGMLQIAISQEVPTISIYGPTDENVYGPYPKSERNIIITSNIDCRPCYKKFKLPECIDKKCLESISVDKVFTTISNNYTL